MSAQSVDSSVNQQNNVNNQRSDKQQRLDPVSIDASAVPPLLHRYALTLFMATQSFVTTIKNDDTLLKKWLTDSGIDPAVHQQYIVAIRNFEKDTVLKAGLDGIRTLLIDKLPGFYPTPPCPSRSDTINIMKMLK